MDQPDINEFHNFLCVYAEEKGFKLNQILSVMAAIFVGTMAQNGFTEEKVNLTLLKMKKDFMIHLDRKNKGK